MLALARAHASLEQLQLPHAAAVLENKLDEAAYHNLPYAQVFAEVLEVEIAARRERYLRTRTNVAHFPFPRTLDQFDFAFQPSLDERQIRELASLAFVAETANVVLLGPPGVGKTHLAVGLGLKAIEHGYRVLFTTAAALITSLTRALTEGRLDDRLKVYTVPRLLSVDEIGYLPIDRAGANLFFQLISRRYERGPMILTSNQSFGSWGEVFGDRVIATAVLDRILHHAITLNIRLKDKLKAGLVRPAEATE